MIKPQKGEVEFRGKYKYYNTQSKLLIIEYKNQTQVFFPYKDTITYTPPKTFKTLFKL